MRVALYVRVSTEEQAVHGLSIEAQTAALEEWAKPYNVVGLYKDEGISARKPPEKRPALQTMLRDVEAGKIDLIAFTKLDRFFRSVGAYYRVQDVLEAHHVAWKAIHEDYETQTASGRLKVNIMLSVAQDEADRTSERIKAVMDRKKENGEVISGSCAFGLQIIDKKYAPNEDAEKVRMMFQKFIDLRSIRGTCQCAREILGRPMSYNGFYDFLSNENYVKTGVVSRQMFDKAQEVKKQRAQRYTVKTDRIYLFSGLAFCHECGRRLTAHQTTNAIYYQCNNNKIDFKCPHRKCTNENKLEAYLLSHLVDGVDEWNRRERAKQKKNVDKPAIRRKMDKLTDLYMNDLIDREKYEREYRACQSLLNAPESSLTIDREEVVTLLGEYQKLDRAHRRAFWSRVLKRIEIDRDGNISFTPG